MIKSELSNESFKSERNKYHSKTSLNDLQKLNSNPKSHTKSEVNPSFLPLSDINVSIDSIIPSDLKPITLYDKNELKVILHLASNSPRIDVKVIVITIINTNHFPVSNINFLAAVPKVLLICVLLSTTVTTVTNTLRIYSKILTHMYRIFSH